MPEIFVYCKTCAKKVKAVILTKHEKEYDDSIRVIEDMVWLKF